MATASVDRAISVTSTEPAGMASTRMAKELVEAATQRPPVWVAADPGTGQSGTWARLDIAKGDCILSMAGCREVPTPDRYTVQVAEGVHLYQSPDMEACNAGASAAYINHSCAPNAYIDTLTRRIVAIRDIQAGEQVTFNYLSSELVMDAPFECLCGHASCFGIIRGYKPLGVTDRDRVSYVAPWIVAKYTKSIASSQ